MKLSDFCKLLCAGAVTLLPAGCSDDDIASSLPADGGAIGEANDVFSAAEWYPGGELGTTTNEQGCYENESPWITQNGMTQTFKEGENSFENNFTVATAPFSGLGPAWVRDGCLKCHPSYGHGWRQEEYRADGYGNGYLLVIYRQDADKSYNENGNAIAANAADSYITEVTGMPQTKAMSPFLPPIDEEQIDIQWLPATDEHGNRFPDGETYELIYPEVSIPLSAFNTDPKPAEGYQVRLESTIGMYGTGLIDAIDNDSLIAQYRHEASLGLPLNPSFWNGSDMAAGAWYGPANNAMWAAGGTPEPRIRRFTYTLSRGSLQDGPGANAIWNITNVSRSDRRAFYSTAAWAKAMSENDDVVKAIQAQGASPLSPLHPFYADGTEEGISRRVLEALSLTKTYDATTYARYHEMGFQDEMSDADYYKFMVWHRGLAVPQARDLDKAEVKRGKQLFHQIGCATCHRPSWTTGDDNYWRDAVVAGQGQLPRYAHQVIWPYSDFIQHRLDMKNDVRTGWCRTTPLWGRGLSLQNTGHEDRMHDCRARNEIEAIMWHGYSRRSDAYESTQRFYNLPKADRDAIVAFIRAI